MEPTENAAPEGAAAPQDFTAGAIEAMDKALAAEAEPTTPEVAEPASEGANPADVPGDKPAAAPAEKTVDEEVAEYGLKEKSAARFRELSGYKAAFKEAGIEKIEDIPRIVERARFADELESAISETRATPEQYGQAIKYLALVNGGAEGMAQAYEIMQAELAVLAKALGREAPGIHDPLAEHDDLREEVESGDISRKRALEIASQRAAAGLSQAQAEAQRQQAESKLAYDRAIADLNALGAQLKASDPHYSTKIAALKPTIALIREHCPPNQWAARTQQAYSQLVIDAPAAPLPPPGPVRSVPASGVAMVAEPKSAMDALEMGLAAASRNR